MVHPFYLHLQLIVQFLINDINVHVDEFVLEFHYILFIYIFAQNRICECMRKFRRILRCDIYIYPFLWFPFAIDVSKPPLAGTISNATSACEAPLISVLPLDDDVSLFVPPLHYQSHIIITIFITYTPTPTCIRCDDAIGVAFLKNMFYFQFLNINIW